MSIEDHKIRPSEISAVDDEDDVALPGFRFHPTDEELVGFYLRRKVEKKPLRIELIKEIDIYKYDPGDLPKGTGVGDNESYFFCRRGRKYKNSIRPNRVTGSGFWKATGIDKPVYSGGPHHQCIGLKKTLVYYRGSAGKGIKTDWMMHEFRLPSSPAAANIISTAKNNTLGLQEAEVWTICRIFKRNVSHRKYTADWKEIASKRHSAVNSSKTCSLESSSTTRESYISFGAPTPHHQYTYKDQKLAPFNCMTMMVSGHWTSSPMAQHLSMASSSSCLDNNIADQDLFTSANWDELASFVQFALDSPLQL